MTIKNLTYQQSVSATETPLLGATLAPNPDVVHSLLPGNNTLTPTSTPPVSAVASGLRTLTAGVLTEDLTNLVGPGAAVVNFNTLKLVFVEISCPATNTQPVTFTNGAANGYNIFGGAASKIIVPPGGSASVYLGTGGQTVDATHKTMDVSSAMAAAQYSIVMGAG